MLQQSRLQEIGVSQMLHHIRAASRKIRREARRNLSDPGISEVLHLSRWLAHAIQQASPFDIAVALGSAAELQYFPDDRTFDLCTRVVQGADSTAVKAVVWAARHRCARAVPHCRRFVVPGLPEDLPA